METSEEARRVIIRWGGEERVLRLFHDWVCVVPFVEAMEIRGIILPDTVRRDQIVAVVAGYGPGLELEDGTRAAIGVSVGDVVVFDRWNLEHRQGVALQQFLGDGAKLIRGTDILLVSPPGSYPRVG